jgi:hypothetical protein
VGNAPVNVRIRYRGRGSLEQFAVAAPKPETVRTVHSYVVGDEIVAVRPGWYLHEITIEREMVTWIVERLPPAAE